MIAMLPADLGASGGDERWILVVYSLRFGLGLVPAGRLGGSIGRGRLLVAGLAVFSTTSPVGATVGEPWLLGLARCQQGLGAGTANPQVIGLL
jgi:MFS family permease